MELIQKFPDEFVFEQKFLLDDYAFESLFEDAEHVAYINVIPVSKEKFLNGPDCIEYQGKYYLRVISEYGGYIIRSASCEAYCSALTYNQICGSEDVHYERLAITRFGYKISKMKLFDTFCVFATGS